MKNIKKYIVTILTMCIMLSMFVPVNAASEISMSYDFDTNGLDSYWTSGWGTNNTNNIGGNTVIDQVANNYAILKFPHAVTSGSIHFSFKLKKKAAGSAFMGFYDTRLNENPPTASTGEGEMTKITYYSTVNYINPFKDPCVWSNWAGSTHDSKDYFNEGDWNKVDVVITDIGTSSMYGKILLNGNLIATDANLDLSNAKGIKGLWWKDEAASSYIDDVVVRSYTGDPMVAVKPVNNTFAVENGSVNFKLSEEVTDATAINADNVIVTDVNGNGITNFNVTNVTSDSFTLTFEGTVPRGVYNVQLSGVTGKSTGATLVESGEIRTEYQYETINGYYENMTFDGYEGGLSLPDGRTFTYNKHNSLSSDGETNAGDAFAVTDVAKKASGFPPIEFGYRSYVTNLTENISGGATVTMKFKVNYANMDWYLKLLENGETDTDRDNGDIVLAVQDGNVVYGSTKTGVATVANASIPSENLVDVNVKITPQSASKSNVDITIGETQLPTLETTRNFFSVSQTQIGIGYKPTDTENSFAIDDIIITGSGVKVVCPEVESITVKDYLDNVQDGKELTSATNKIEILFNTLVDHDSVEDGLTISGFSYESVVPEDVGGKTRLTINVPDLLPPSDKLNKNSISISLSDAVTDAGGNNLRLLPYSKQFTVLKDATFEIYDETEITTASTEYYLKAVKTDDKAYNFMSVVAGYKTKTVDGKDYKELVRIYYVPVEWAEGETGAKTFPETPLNIQFNDCDTVEVTKMNMPSMSIFE